MVTCHVRLQLMWRIDRHLTHFASNVSRCLRCSEFCPILLQKIENWIIKMVMWFWKNIKVIIWCLYFTVCHSTCIWMIWINDMSHGKTNCKDQPRKKGVFYWVAPWIPRKNTLQTYFKLYILVWVIFLECPS